MGLLRHRFVFMQVSGTSMQPTLQPGQVVVGDRNRKAKVGDIVFFAHPETGGWFVKRLTKIENDGYWVEGDAHDPSTAATSTDSWVFGPLEWHHIKAVVIWPRKSRKRLD